jgi:hypothetical protein
VSEVQSKIPGRRRFAVRRRLGAPVVAADGSSRTTRVEVQPLALSKRDVAGLLRGAAEICLIGRDPHLAVRAAWVLLREQGMSDGKALSGRAVRQ